MSEDCSNNQNEPVKLGCGAKIGITLLVLAVLTVLFIFLIKPALEEKGVDVNGYGRKIVDQSKVVWDVTKDSTGKGMKKGIESVRDLKEQAEDAADNAGEKIEKITEDAADAFSDAADNVKKNSRKSLKKVDELKEKTEEKIESWY